MAKHKSAKELMAERNPLARKAVEPVDIYSQPPVPTEPAKATQGTEAVVSESSNPEKKKTPQPKQKDIAEGTRPYSTYLKQSQVKGIKLRAIEDNVNDQIIVQAAVDEYLAKHPL